MRSPGGSPVALARIETPESTSTPRAQGRKRRNRLVFFEVFLFGPEFDRANVSPFPKLWIRIVNQAHIGVRKLGSSPVFVKALPDGKDGFA